MPTEYYQSGIIKRINKWIEIMHIFSCLLYKWSLFEWILRKKKNALHRWIYKLDLLFMVFNVIVLLVAENRLYNHKSAEYMRRRKKNNNIIYTKDQPIIIGILNEWIRAMKKANNFYDMFFVSFMFPELIDTSKTI